MASRPPMLKNAMASRPPMLSQLHATHSFILLSSNSFIE